MKEEPNIQFFFDDKIARIVFEDDPERKVYWLEIPSHYYLPYLHLYLLQHFLRLPIEEWLTQQGMSSVEEDTFLFELTWS